ncbi:MAG: helix-turn-helix transcriptional regulator [Pseudomonadota bacterium]
MDEAQAISAFAAMGQTDRLRILRRLVTAGPAGLAAGALAEALAIAPSRLSFHLRALEAAGLVHARADARRRVYAPDYRALGDLAAYLLHDCCGSDPEALKRCGLAS